MPVGRWLLAGARPHKHLCLVCFLDPDIRVMPQPYNQLLG